MVIEEGERVVRFVDPRSGHRRPAARVEDAYIGPYFAIARTASSCAAEVEHTILLEESGGGSRRARGEQPHRPDVTIARTSRSRAYRFMIGDSSSIGLV